MKARCVKISGELLTRIFKAGSDQHFRVSKNGLPEDARLVEIGNGYQAGGEIREVWLWFESSVFQDSDPDDLPDVIMQSLYPALGEYKPYGEL